jgi:hypothetical protein
MARFKKEANLIAAAETAGKGIVGLGKGVWHGAKAIGGGANKAIQFKGLGGEVVKLPITHAQLRGAGVLGGAGYVASQAPAMAREAERNRQEAMIPWQGRRTYL